MGETAEVWAGAFGDAYTRRNRVDWRARIPFWRTVIDETGARSVYEFGCNAGWNLSAIRRAFPDVALHGEDVNYGAILQARTAGLSDADAVTGRMPESDLRAELAFTVGVLIHIPPHELPTFLYRVVNKTYRYVLAVEYEADTETEIEYRGQPGMLWKRPFGTLYEALGLNQVMKWPAGESFDNCNCTAWLMEKP